MNDSDSTYQKTDSAVIHQTTDTAALHQSATVPYKRTPKIWIDPALPYPPEYIEGYLPPISTAITDSIAADTVAPHILTTEQMRLLTEKHRADSIAAAEAYTEAHSGHAEGIAGEAIQPSFGHLDPISILVSASLVVAGLSAGSIGRALRAYRPALFSIRRRQNAFDDTHTAPLRASLILALITAIFGGLALYCSTPYSLNPTFTGVLIAIGIAAAYYIFMLCAYTITGYAFANPQGRDMWIDGYVASMAYTGLALVIPVLLMLYMPQWRTPLLCVCSIMFISAKIIFIIKGFRIFYNKIRSLLYFILYLCTLEIIPVLAFYAVLCYLESIEAA